MATEYADKWLKDKGYSQDTANTSFADEWLAKKQQGTEPSLLDKAGQFLQEPPAPTGGIGELASNVVKEIPQFAMGMYDVAKPFTPLSDRPLEQQDIDKLAETALGFATFIPRMTSNLAYGTVGAGIQPALQQFGVDISPEVDRARQEIYQNPLGHILGGMAGIKPLSPKPAEVIRRTELPKTAPEKTTGQVENVPREGTMFHEKEQNVPRETVEQPAVQPEPFIEQATDILVETKKNEYVKRNGNWHKIVYEGTDINKPIIEPIKLSIKKEKYLNDLAEQRQQPEIPTQKPTPEAVEQRTQAEAGTSMAEPKKVAEKAPEVKSKLKKKEDWELTLDEAIDRHSIQATGSRNIPEGFVRGTYKSVIEDAIKEGKPVPKHVLDEAVSKYPELSKLIPEKKAAESVEKQGLEAEKPAIPTTEQMKRQQIEKMPSELVKEVKPKEDVPDLKGFPDPEQISKEEYLSGYKEIKNAKERKRALEIGERDHAKHILLALEEGRTPYRGWEKDYPDFAERFATKAYLAKQYAEQLPKEGTNVPEGGMPGSEAVTKSLKEVRQRHGEEVENIETKKREGGYVNFTKRVIRQDVGKQLRDKHPEVENFFERTKKLPQQRLNKFKEGVRETFIPFQKLKRKGLQKEYAETVEDLRILKGSNRAAASQAVKDLQGIVQDTDFENFELAKRSVFTDDLIFTAKQEKGTPVELSKLESYKADLDKLLDQNPTARAIIKRYREYMDALREDLIERGKLDESARGNKNYVPHQVIDYIAAKGRTGGTGSKNRIPGRGYTKARLGSERDIYTDWLEVTFTHINQVLRDNIIEDGLVNIANKHSVKPKIIEIGDKKVPVIPEGYTQWSPRKGKLLTVEPAPVVQRAILNNTEALFRSPDTYAKLGDISPIEELTGKDVYIIPKELAETLEEFNIYQPKGITATAVRTWKRYILNVNPIRYNRRNFVGDFERVMAADPPDATLYPAMKRAFIDIRDANRGNESVDYQLATEYGVIGSGKYRIEAQKIRQLPEFEHLKGLTKRRELIKSAGQKTWGKMQNLTGNREDFLRLAEFYRNLDRIRSGKKMNAGISNIEGINNLEKAAAKVSREMLGDYGNFTSREEAWRNGVAPFYSWLKINTSFWTKLFTRQGLTKTSATVAGKQIARSSIRGVTYGVGTIYAATTIYNNLVYPEQEEKLPQWARGRFHINTGKQDKDGKEIIITDPTALDDYLETLGLEGSSADIISVLKGRKTIKEVAKSRALNIIKAPANAIVNRMSPYIKVPIETVTGRKLFPDVFSPGYISSKPEKRTEEAIKGITGTDMMNLYYLFTTEKAVGDALGGYNPIPFKSVKNYDMGNSNKKQQIQQLQKIQKQQSQ